MAIRADRIEHFIARRTAAVLHSPATVAAGDASPLPIFDWQGVSVFTSAELNVLRVDVFASVLREMGVTRLGWDLTSLHATGRDRFRAGVAFSHFDALDRCVGSADAVLYLDFAGSGPRLVMLEFIHCPVWTRVLGMLSRNPAAPLN